MQEWIWLGKWIKELSQLQDALVAPLKCIPPAIFINLVFLHRNMPLHPVIFRLCLWAEIPYLATVCSVTLAISTDSMAAPSNQSFILSETTHKVKAAQKVKIWQQNLRAPAIFSGFASSIPCLSFSSLWDAAYEMPWACAAVVDSTVKPSSLGQ